MRGKAEIPPPTFPPPRITPAYAGKSDRYLCINHCKQDHPRLCGEKCSRYSMDASYLGSPPPMRGKAKTDTTAGTKSGITPAYAGKRQLSAFPLKVVWDHPRLCGEKFKRFLVKCFVLGSPPPMRGKVIKKWDYLRTQRITPAYAGKRKEQLAKLDDEEDHPRLCGEKSLPEVHWSMMLGSPPPMRGKEREVRTAINHLMDHPRLCGEKAKAEHLHSHRTGSPPPMRGKVVNDIFQSIRQRITPAYAGKRLTPEHFSQHTKDHPRLCGEKSGCRCPLDSRQGSPPPMRGKAIVNKVLKLHE